MSKNQIDLKVAMIMVSKCLVAFSDWAKERADKSYVPHGHFRIIMFRSAAMLYIKASESMGKPTDDPDICQLKKVYHAMDSVVYADQYGSRDDRAAAARGLEDATIAFVTVGVETIPVFDASPEEEKEIEQQVAKICAIWKLDVV